MEMLKLNEREMKLPKTTNTTIRVTRFFPRRDSAETLLPGTVCQSLISMPTYRMEINVNGTM